MASMDADEPGAMDLAMAAVMEHECEDCGAAPGRECAAWCPARLA